MNELKRLAALLFAAAFMIGCISEESAPCGTSLLHFRFTNNSESVNRFDTDVGSIRFFAFDHSSGLLVSVSDFVKGSIGSDGTVPFDTSALPAGRYTFVAWAVGGDSLTDDFSLLRMDDPVAHITSEIRVGETTLDKMYMLLRSAPVASALEGDIAPLTADFDDLFWAVNEDFEITRSGSHVIEFDFIRDTHILNVAVTGLSLLSSTAPSLDIFVVGRNGRYSWSNSIDEYARKVRYQGHGRTLLDEGMTLRIKTLRFHAVRHLIDPVLLYIEDPSGVLSVPGPIDVVKTILDIRDSSGGYLYREQSDIDRRYDYPVEIRITDEPGQTGGGLTVKVYIGNWEAVTLVPSIKGFKKR